MVPHPVLYIIVNIIIIDSVITCLNVFHMIWRQTFNGDLNVFPLHMCKKTTEEAGLCHKTVVLSLNDQVTLHTRCVRGSVGKCNLNDFILNVAICSMIYSLIEIFMGSLYTLGVV